MKNSSENQMTTNLSIVMLGASGAVGGITAQALSQMPELKQLTLLNRRDIPVLALPRVVQLVRDVTDAGDYAQFLSGHQVAICCLGVGQPSKVSKEEFVKIDKTAALDFATACKQAGVRHFQLLSSVRADAKSNSLYLRIKGELQDAIVALGFERVSFFQPSMILTPTNRYGFLQGLMLAVWPAISVVLQGGLRKYRGVKVETLGSAIAKNAITTAQGIENLLWDQIIKL
jgi:uncharacterized protein YbjT (DUF2867 family)